jgi:hypothetical protein
MEIKNFKNIENNLVTFHIYLPEWIIGLCVLDRETKKKPDNAGKNDSIKAVLNKFYEMNQIVKKS